MENNYLLCFRPIYRGRYDTRSYRKCALWGISQLTGLYNVGKTWVIQLKDERRIYYSKRYWELSISIMYES